MNEEFSNEICFFSSLLAKRKGLFTFVVDACLALSVCYLLVMSIAAMVRCYSLTVSCVGCVIFIYSVKEVFKFLLFVIEPEYFVIVCCLCDREEMSLRRNVVEWMK
jgi:hypothetical protein